MTLDIEEKLERALPRIANRVQTELILASPVDRGGLRLSIKVFPSQTGIGLTIFMNETGKFVEFGTPPHIIKAKPGKVLHWHKTKGRTQHQHPHSKSMEKDAFFAKEVKHPGTRPNPFIRNTIQTKLSQIIQEEILRVI